MDHEKHYITFFPSTELTLTELGTMQSSGKTKLPRFTLVTFLEAELVTFSYF